MSKQEESLESIVASILPDINSLVFSKPVTAAPYEKIRGRKEMPPENSKIRAVPFLPFYVEFFTKTQVFHRRFDIAGLQKLLLTETGIVFRTVIINTPHEQITVLANKKKHINILRKAQVCTSCFPVQAISPQTSHNRQKNYILQEGHYVPFLEALGLMTQDGKVVTKKYDKFRQVNRFLEYIQDVLPNILPAEDRPLRILDFGCGKSYLSFALYYFLTELKGVKTEIIGLDLKADVINHCKTLAKNWNYTGLHFQTGSIEEYRKNQEDQKLFGTASKPPDMLISLHACDTATDYALAYAAEHGVKVILSVPCCQHEINAKLGKTCPDTAFSSFMKYGIIKERFSALATDLMRAELLEEAGYTVQVLEFIDIAHTPKNLLIRAIKKSNKKTVDMLSEAKTGGQMQKPSPYDALCTALGLTNTLDFLLTKTS